MKILVEGEVVIVERDNLCATITRGQVLEIEHDRDDKELYNFKMVTALENNKFLLTLILILI